jgi:hypothetical protein
MIKYFVCFERDYFKTIKMFFIGMKDSERNRDHFWLLTEDDPLNWLPIDEDVVDITNKIQINSELFYKIKNLSKKERSLITKFDTHIELFQKWGLLEDIEEYLI